MARLRVITWNVHGSARPRIDAVADLLRAHEPDVVALQEVRSGQARRISALLGWPRPAWAFKHNGYWPLWWRAEGLAVLSHHRLALHPAVSLTPGISRRSYRRRILLPVELLVSAEEEEPRVLLVDAHLSSGAADEDRRTEQARRVAALLPDAMPVILAGDLNATPSQPSIAVLLESGLEDAWTLAGTGDGATIPANAPRRRIDYVMVRGGLGVTAAAVVDDLGAAMSGLSDHRPVEVTLELDDDDSPQH